MMKSPLWLETSSIPKFPTLDQELTVDICLVGAGITGITLAYLLKDTPLKIALIDSDEFLHGSTAYTTAKLTAQHDLIYATMIKNYGLDQAKYYAQAQRQAIQFVRKTCEQLNIDCHLETLPAYLYTDDDQQVQNLVDEFEAAKQIGFDCDLLDELDLPFPVKKALVYHEQAQYHPLHFLTGLLQEVMTASNMNLYANTPARDLRLNDNGTYSVLTDTNFSIHAKKVVQCCHFPFYDDLSLLFARAEINHSYLMAIEKAHPFPKGMYLSVDSDSHTIRTYDSLLIVGGESHRPGTVVDTNQNYQKIKDFAKTYFHSDKVVYEWSTQDYVTSDQIPYIGRLHADNDSLYVATGYCKWGMSNGIVAALLLADLIQEKENPWASLFAPSRFNLKAQFKELLKNNAEVAFEYIKGKLKKGDKSLYLDVDEATIIQTDHGKYGVYKDQDGNLYTLDITCPHMGCELVFNTAEKTWDCPCHGSRFSYRGEVIEGPAHTPLSSHKNHIDPNVFN